MKLIPLSQGKFARVSDHQFERIVQYGAWVYANGYAVTNVKTEEGWKAVRMHNVIKPPPEGFTVDHVDGDGINNEDENLRFASKSQQKQNAKRHKNNTSGITGVTWLKAESKWKVVIEVNGTEFYLGRYKTIEEAANARKLGEQKYFGAYSCLNPERPHSRQDERSNEQIKTLEEFF